MILSFCSAILLILLCEGTGSWTLNILGIEKEGYSAPIGTAVIFSVLEVVFLPALLLHTGFTYVLWAAGIVFLAAAAVSFQCRAEIAAKLFRKRTLYVVISAVLFLFLLQNYDINVILHDDTELARINSLVNTNGIFLSVYRLQGYLLLESFLAWAGSFVPAMPVYTLGILIHVISAMLYLNIIDSFHLRNPWLKFTIIVCSLFYMGFYSWRIAGAFHAANWRIVFVGMMLFCIYEWFRKGNEQIKYLLLFIIGAGMFSHPYFSAISIIILMCALVFCFHEEKIRSLFDFTTFIIPHIIYISCLLWEKIPWTGLLLFAAYTAFCFMRYKKKLRRMLVRLEDFLIEYHTEIFLIGLPAVAAALTLILRVFFPQLAIPYRNYLFFFDIKPARNYLFLHSTMLDNVMNVIRWFGLILLMVSAKEKENRLVRLFYIQMITFYLNPLCMGTLANLAGISLYASVFEILFNPFTDIVIFVALYHAFEWKTLLQWVLEITLIFVALYGHIASFMRLPFGLYTDLLRNSENVIEVDR